MIRRALAVALLALSFLLACHDEAPRPATQLFVRLHASPDTQLSGARLRMIVNGQNELGDRALSDIPSWPVDVPIVPRDPGALPERIEIVADVLDARGASVAQDRAVTSFVRGEQRLLALTLAACTSERPVCEVAACGGEQCTHCVQGSCQPVGFTPGATLETVIENATIAPDPKPSCSASLRCRGKALERCEGGVWSVVETCTHVCLQDHCAGVCTPGETPDRCSPADGHVSERCGAQGEWEAEERCPFLCAEGACVGSCLPESTRCEGERQQRCDASGSYRDEKLCGQFCLGNACQDAPSCRGVDLRCADNESCCASRRVEGGSFFRSYDGVEHTSQTAPARVSPFLLDRFEVTVGRFRRWVRAYDDPGSRPSPGAGKNPSDPADGGWQATWSGALPADARTLRAQLSGCMGSTWTEAGSDEQAERAPINCVSWYVAQAFCIWDGGRLPTEAEWNFAAAGGAEQRVFPWSTPPSDQTVDTSRMVYGVLRPAPVGSKPRGDGRFGQADLAGNVAEWVKDAYADAYPEGLCVDCAVATAAEFRVIRGGAFKYWEGLGMGSFRGYGSANDAEEGNGFRCARP